jgi:hypothetical protein
LVKEAVHNIIEFWDCPRSGIAFFQERPHAFECIFDENIDDWSMKYRLLEIQIDIFNQMKQNDRNKLKWDNKIYKTTEDKASFPVLPEDQELSAQVNSKIEDIFSRIKRSKLIMEPQFHKIVWNKTYEVTWKEIKTLYNKK